MAADGTALLHQLDALLSWDPLIDELAFLHPSQLAALHENGSSSSGLPASTDRSTFWCGDHKLAVSSSDLGSLNRASKSAFLDTLKEYRSALSTDPNQVRNDRDLIKRLLSYTRLVIVLNSSNMTAWNTRKQIFSKTLFEVPLTELGLSSLTLSINPKCEAAWAHRRWVINSHIQRFIPKQIPEDLLQGEFKLIEIVAERSRMNYRAWSHCCWLVPAMSLSQVLHELQKWKRWAELHVADNSCFHFLQCLFQRLTGGEEAASIWQDEIKWNNRLIEAYIGREALWMHRRFLFFEGHKYFNHADNCLSYREFVEREIEYVGTFVTSCSCDGDEATRRQISYASAYKLWILVCCTEDPVSHLWEQELHQAQQLLDKFAVHQKRLWDGILQKQ